MKIQILSLLFKISWREGLVFRVWTAFVPWCILLMHIIIFPRNLVIIMQNLLMLSHGPLWELASFVPLSQTGSVLCRAPDMVDWCTFTEEWPLTFHKFPLRSFFVEVLVRSFKCSSVLIFTVFLQVTPFIMTSKLCFISYCDGYFNNSQIEVKCEATVPSLRQFFICAKAVLLQDRDKILSQTANGIQRGSKV